MNQNAMRRPFLPALLIMLALILAIIPVVVLAEDTDPAGQTLRWKGDQKVFVEVAGHERTAVNLEGLEAVMWTDPTDGASKPAVPVETVVRAAAGSTRGLESAKFNLLATDGYDLLRKKIWGDARKLPGGADLSRGRFIAYQEEGFRYTDIKIVWDKGLGFTGSYNARMMNGGTIRTVESLLFEHHETIFVGFAGAKARTPVDLYGLALAQRGGKAAVRLHHIVLEAGLEGFNPKNRKYAFDFANAGSGSDRKTLRTEAGGAISSLPAWADPKDLRDLQRGWLVLHGKGDLRLDWSAETGYSEPCNLTHMSGGAIEVLDITMSPQ